MVKLGRDQVSFVNSMQVSFSFFYIKKLSALHSIAFTIYEKQNKKKKLKEIKSYATLHFAILELMSM